MKAKEGKTPNRFRAWALIGIIGVPLSLAPVLNGGTGGTPGDSASVQSTVQQSSQAVPLGASEQVKSDRALQVNGSDTFSPITAPYLDPVSPKGGKLVGVFMTIKNIGKESGNMFWTKFQLEDSQGRKYDDIEDFTEIVTLNSWAKNQGLAETGDQLFPGATAKTVSVFRVAPDAEGLKLIVNGNKAFAIE